MSSNTFSFNSTNNFTFHADLVNNFPFNDYFEQNKFFGQISFDSNINDNNLHKNNDLLDKTLAMLNDASSKIQNAIFETRKIVPLMDVNFTSKNEAEENAKGGKESRKEQLFKTELCSNFKLFGYCKYGNGCWYAHNLSELKPVPAHLPATPKTPKANNNNVLLFCVFHSINALRGALVRTGRATSKNWEDGEGGIYYVNNENVAGQRTHQLSDGLVIFPRSSRSLYDAGAEGSSVLRSQRGILQQEQPLIIIDADDGQLMRYGR
ncbi:C3H1-type domain-containing protein [Meloidogyne graminicola]|uniref:C3H1-type domain-containing protein n=1 Tax=Meloidogyne graminicola TaxID=189291 RepID=A0A8S9ZK22_9BILA|nr:C3H1-type domain-containing protein [Meloidogyne graminicola]